MTTISSSMPEVQMGFILMGMHSYYVEIEMMQREHVNIITRKTNANNHGLVIYAISANWVYLDGICIVTTKRLQI